MVHVTALMFEKKLLLNLSKTESITIGKPSERKNVQICRLEVNGKYIALSEEKNNTMKRKLQENKQSLKGLGVLFAETVSMSGQINYAHCKFHFGKIGEMALRGNFYRKMSRTAYDYIGSLRLNYFNSPHWDCYVTC